MKYSREEWKGFIEQYKSGVSVRHILDKNPEMKMSTLRYHIKKAEKQEPQEEKPVPAATPKKIMQKTIVYASEELARAAMEKQGRKAMVAPVIIPRSETVPELPKIERRRVKIAVEPAATPEPAKAEKAKPTKEEESGPVKKVKRPRRVFEVEAAKSGRGRCSGCKQTIGKGEIRMGVVTFYPHRSVRWHHCSKECLGILTFSMTPENLKGVDKLPAADVDKITEVLKPENVVAIPQPLVSLSGKMSVAQMAQAMTGRYNRFRQFRFGLSHDQMYTSNWNWRCFLATILVCNSKEVHMLNVVEKLFKTYPTPSDLLKLKGDKETQKMLKNDMEKDKLRHVGRKLFSIINATDYLLREHDGEVPKSRSKLQSLPGVGTHVSSVTMAWVHEAPEFGVDVHVRRILERWGYIEPKDPEDVVEAKIKSQIPQEQVGHFSRSFVDHGQSICGYTPDCGNCYLNKACPSASKYMDW